MRLKITSSDYHLRKEKEWFNRGEQLSFVHMKHFRGISIFLHWNNLHSDVEQL